MSIRVNLLRPEEIRHPGALDRGLLVRGGAVVGLSLLVIAGVWAGFQYHEVIGGHARVKARWATLEPEYQRIKAVRDAHTQNQDYLRELDSWTASRIPWTEPFAELRQLVPANLQLTRMTVIGETKISEAEPGTKEEPGTPARRFTWRLEGRAQGAMSDQDVVQFVDTLRTGASYQDWMASVKLQGLQRTRSRTDEFGDERTFRVDAASHERLIK